MHLIKFIIVLVILTTFSSSPVASRGIGINWDGKKYCTEVTCDPLNESSTIQCDNTCIPRGWKVGECISPPNSSAAGHCCCYTP
ncbi:hypothetical protein CTI12_AA437200 [Artemisia annua]|uniref:Uncharacterized protein n=1 Tax=Artemisia annua TaxID=35608 RepID=A0A2U1L2L3_ARTAN|nr:hypothetical protein CTI12_AA437200 [Artemisia annua]